MNDKGYHKLIIWQKGRELVTLVYLKTENFPRSEMLGLQSQLRRAMISVVLNIVEGQRRNSKKEFLKFLNISEGSLVEVEACLELSLDLKFITEEEYHLLEEKRRELAIILRAFINGLKKNNL